MTRRKNVTVPFYRGMAFFAFKASRGFVYLKMRIYKRKTEGYFERQIPFNRGNYDEKFDEWCALAKEVMDLKRAPKEWAENKPDFDDLLIDLKLNEVIHYRYEQD